MPLPGHQKILQSAAQVLFLLPCSLTEAAPGGQACGHSGGEGLGWPRGLSSPLLELTSPGHTLLTSPQLLALPQEHTPTRDLANYGEGKKGWVQSWVMLQKEGEIRAVAEEQPTPHSRCWRWAPRSCPASETAAPELLFRHGMVAHCEEASSIRKEHNTSLLSLDIAAKPSKRFCAKTALSAPCLCSAQRQPQGLKHLFK